MNETIIAVSKKKMVRLLLLNMVMVAVSAFAAINIHEYNSDREIIGKIAGVLQGYCRPFVNPAG